jgi:hypothetical protein
MEWYEWVILAIGIIVFIFTMWNVFNRIAVETPKEKA